MRFILEKFELSEAIELDKEQKDRKNVDNQSKSAIIKNINEFSNNQKFTPELENIESIKNLAIKYSKENDPENTFIYMNKLIQAGKFIVPLNYSIFLYKNNHFEQSFNYFCLLSKYNHPIAKYFIGIMKYFGKGCDQNVKESYEIMKNLADNGIDKAIEFLEEKFDN